MTLKTFYSHGFIRRVRFAYTKNTCLRTAVLPRENNALLTFVLNNQKRHVAYNSKESLLHRPPSSVCTYASTAIPFSSVPSSSSGKAWKVFMSIVAVGTIYVNCRHNSSYAMCLNPQQSFVETELGDITDFKEGELYEIKVLGDQHAVLLVYTNGSFHCTGAKCSHYSAPLVKGISSEQHVTCPWHDAEFDIKTGRAINGPALNSIPVYATIQKEGKVYALLPSDMQDSLKPHTVKRDPSDNRVFAIVGGGASALAAAETLRQEGYTGRIIMLTNEAIPPYDRPVLSKNLKADISKIILRDEAFLKELDIEFRPNCPVASVKATENTIKLFSGEVLKYDKVLISTGSEPRPLNVPGNNLKNIFFLRRPEDSQKISEFAKQNVRVVVVGSSFIGVEAAAALSKANAKVSVIGKESVPLQRVLGEKVGGVFKALLQEKGVEFIPNASVKCFRGKGGVVNAVELEDGNVIQADAVVVGAGVTLNTDLVEGIIKESDGSILVDPFFRSVDAPNLYVAGDIAKFPYLKTGENIRVEHWDVALQHGRYAAKNMNGGHTPYTSTPFFWSMAFNKSLRYAGYCKDFDDVIIEGDLKGYRFVAYYIKNNVVAAVATMGMDPIAVASSEALKLNLMPSVPELQLGIANSASIVNKLKEHHQKINPISVSQSTA